MTFWYTFCKSCQHNRFSWLFLKFKCQIKMIIFNLHRLTWQSYNLYLIKTIIYFSPKKVKTFLNYVHYLFVWEIISVKFSLWDLKYYLWYLWSLEANNPIFSTLHSKNKLAKIAKMEALSICFPLYVDVSNFTTKG